MRTAAARGQVAPFQVMRIVELAAARRSRGMHVYDMCAGQPFTPAPAPVLALARRALETDRLAYTAALGVPPLREAIAAHYARTYDLQIDPASVAVTTGSSGGFLLACLAAFNAGDVVVVPRPGYPAYRNLLEVLGCRVIELACGPEDRFQPTLDQLRALRDRPAGVILGSPSNPTGTMLTAPELAAIADWCDEWDVRLISDEIYHGITYGPGAASAWQTSRSSVVVQSFSKYFSMTGWRLGWLLLPDELVDPVDRLAGNLALCPPTLAQLAAVGAFEAYAELDANVARYRRNRDMMTTRLPAIGIDRIAPAEGAFYLYADVSRWTSDSLTFAMRLLDETGVALASGVDFDPVDGGRFIRMCFAGDHGEISRAIDLLGDWLAAERR